MPNVTAGIITFFTNDDDKDHDTQITVLVKDSDGLPVAGFEGLNGPHDRFPDHTEHSVDLKIDNQSERINVENGRITIAIKPVGNDTWKFGFRLRFFFSDGLDISRRFDHVTLSEDRLSHTFQLST